MWGPRPALVFEGAVVEWMPIPREEDWGPRFPEQTNVRVDDGNYLVAILHRKSATGAEVILNVDNDKRGLLVNCQWQVLHRLWWDRTTKLSVRPDSFTVNTREEQSHRR